MATDTGTWDRRTREDGAGGREGGREHENSDFQPVSMNGAEARRTEGKTNKSKLEKRIIKDECQALWR